MIAGLTLENAVARRPLLPLGRRLVPEAIHGQNRRPATAWKMCQQGTCPQDHDRAQGFREKRKARIRRAESCLSRDDIGFTWQNTLQFVRRMRKSWSKFPFGVGHCSRSFVVQRFRRSARNGIKMEQSGKCERCGDVGAHRWINDLLRFRLTKIGAVLCQKCYEGLMQADARAWQWFRKFRDRLPN